MSIGAITNTFSTHAQQVVSGSSGPKPNAVQAAAQEATETAATTLKEAQSGDRVAQQKLAKLQSQQHQAAAPKVAAEPGKGAVIDHTA